MENDKYIKALHPFMMTPDFDFEKKESIDSTFLQNKLFYCVNEKDSLFWTLFILIHGYQAYESLLPTSFIKEKQEKFQFIDLLKDPYSKIVLKEKQVKTFKNEIEDNLANDETISVKTFIVLAILNKVDFLFVENKKLFKNGMLSKTIGENPKIFIVRYDPEKKESCIDLYFSLEETSRMFETFFPWENIEKPLKSISFYTLTELMEIAKKMGYTKDNGFKTEVYDYISDRVKG
jgi:hypothetical protein